MQVLGDLVSMPSGTSLPLPWWHRAPLGLQSGTNCFVATIKNSSRVVPDVIVSVLRPTNDRLWISLTHREEPGVVMRVISQLTEVNIALAESATLEGGAYHQVTLVCEPKHDGASLPKASEIERQFAERGLEPHVREYEQPHVVFEEPAIIRSGWIDNVDWHKFVKEDLTPASLATVDLSQAVVSADTKTRILRYVFPRLGSRTVRVRHRDQAGVLYMILAEIQQSGINMLSMVLKRGGAKANTAVLVAVCEPPADRSAEGVFYELKEKLDLFEPKYQIRVKIAASVKADSAVNPHENATVVAHVPAELQKTVQRIRLTVRQNQLGIFLSHRLRRSQQSTGLEGEVRAAIQDSEAVPIELDPGASERSASYQEVVKRLWSSDAGIIIMTLKDGTEIIGRSLPPEFGFLQGQAKPVVLLVEDTRHTGSDWTTVDGIDVVRFAPGSRALDRNDEGSIYQCARRIAHKIKETLKVQIHAD